MMSYTWLRIYSCKAMYISKINQTSLFQKEFKICKVEELSSVPALTLSAPFIVLLVISSSETFTTDSFIKELLSQPRPIII